jgi:predicted Fe-S protein YdhL (DUF1289 family)
LPLPASPCVGICEIDAATGFCRGCARTDAEVAAWRNATDAYRDAVWAILPDRAAALGITVRRLEWDAATILDFVEETLQGQGFWEMGSYGAVAAFRRSAGEPCEVRRGESVIEAVTPRAALRLSIEGSVRAFAFGGRMMLVLPRVRLGAPASVVTALGPDLGAVLATGRGGLRFDLGLGQPAARFTVRIADGDRPAAIAAAEGLHWVEHLPAIRAAGPQQVVETAIGRIEIDAPIKTHADACPLRPRAHLLPRVIAEGLELPPDLSLPAAYAPGATFYP